MYEADMQASYLNQDQDIWSSHRDPKIIPAANKDSLFIQTRRNDWYDFVLE